MMLQWQLQQQHHQLREFQQLHQFQESVNLGHVTNHQAGDGRSNSTNWQSASPTFMQLQNSTGGGMKTNMVMDTLQKCHNQGTDNNTFHNLGSVFNTGGGENLLMGALTSNNATNNNSHCQAPEQQENDQHLPTRLMPMGPAVPNSYAGSVLLEPRKLQCHQQQSQYVAQQAAQDQPHQRHENPRLNGHDQTRQNSFAVVDTVQTSINGMGGNSFGIDNKPFQDTLLSMQSVANEPGDTPSVSSFRGNSIGGIHFLQQQLATLQQQLLQQQPNAISVVTHVPDHQQLSAPYGHLNEQSLQLDPQKHFTQLQQSLDENANFPQIWMQDVDAGQYLSQSLGQNDNRILNPASLSFIGPSLVDDSHGLAPFPCQDAMLAQPNLTQQGSIQGLHTMSGLQQFHHLLQRQSDQSDQQSFIGSTNQSKGDGGMQVSLSDNSSDGPQNDPDVEHRNRPLKSKKMKVGTGKKKKTKTFPEKLMRAMMEHNDEDAIAWLPDGKSFVIVNPDLFCGEMLRHVFKESKYASFVRKLHRWGFVRLTSGTGTDCFHHPLFQKNRAELVTTIVCAPRSDKDERNPGPGSLNKPPSLAGVEKFIRAKVVAATKTVAVKSEENGSAAHVRGRRNVGD
jgi:hypothetical protein